MCSRDARASGRPHTCTGAHAQSTDALREMLAAQQAAQQAEMNAQKAYVKPTAINGGDTGGAPDIDPAEIKFDATTDFIGRGVFGNVYKGTCRGQVVAIKVPLNQQSLTTDQLDEFRQVAHGEPRVCRPI